jgi:hypothetical protein
VRQGQYSLPRLMLTKGTSRVSCTRTRLRDPCHMTRSGPAKARGTELRTPERRGIPARRSAAPHVRRIVARPETFQTPKPRRCRGSSVPVIGSRTTERQPTCSRYRKPSAFVSCAISATYRPNSEKSRGKVGQCFRFFRDFLDPIPNG